MDDAEPTRPQTVADSESEQTTTIPDSSETARAELAWSAAPAEQETEAFNEKHSRALKALAPTPPSASAPPAPPSQGAPPSPSAAGAPAPVAPPPPSPPSASPTPAPVEAAPTYAPPPPQEPGPDADQRFLALASHIPGITIADPVAGAASARGICRGIENGRTPEDEAVATSNNTGLTPEHAAALVTAAISVYCPQYLG
jgi:hypothetical protein